MEEFGYYVTKFRLTYLENHHTQSGPDTFNEWRLIMTFFTNLEVREILCIFRKVLERKAGKEIPESSRFEFLQKFLANNSIKAVYNNY